MSASHGPTPEAATLIRSSPAAGAGRDTSSTTTTSGAPKRWIRAAFMFERPLIVLETDPSHSFGLLRACGSKQRDELASPHIGSQAKETALYPLRQVRL